MWPHEDEKSPKGNCAVCRRDSGLVGLPQFIRCVGWWMAFLFLCDCAVYSVAQSPGENLELLAGHPVSVILTPGAGSTVRINVGGSEADEIMLQTGGSDVIFQILFSGGPQIQSGRVKTAGWMPILLAASGHKQALLRLNVEGFPQGQPRVRVRIDRLRIPLSTLSAHTRAAHLYSVALAHHNSLQRQDVRQAIGEYQAAAVEWGRTNDKYGEEIALGGEGESQFELSEYSQAAKTLDRAIGLDKKNDYLHAWLAHLAARACLDEWEARDAKRYAEESLSLGSGLNAPELIAAALADRSEAGFLTHDETAETDAEGALSAAQSSGLPETAAFALRTQAWIEEDQGRISHALTLMAEADALFRRAGSARRALETAEDLTTLKGMTGDQYAALTRHIELAPLSRDSGNLVAYGISLENIGDDYAALNRHSLASGYYERAKRAYFEVRFRSGESLILGRICRMQRDSGDLPEALTNCTRSKDIAMEIGDQKRIAIAMYRQGSVYARMGEAARDRKQNKLADQANHQARDVFTQAVQISRGVNDNRAEAFERIALGAILESLRRRQEAFHEFDQALRLSTGANGARDGTDRTIDVDPADKLEALYHMARWYAEDGQYEMANEELKPALQEIEAARRSVTDSTLQASYFAAERKCYELGVDLRLREYERNPTAGSDAVALQMSEDSRARGLLDALNRTAADRERVEGDMQGKLTQMNMAVDRTFNQRLRLILEGATKRELDTNAGELTDALGALERAEDELNAQADSANQSSRAMTVAEIENMSRSSNTTYLEYALGQERSYLWVIDRGELKSYALAPRDQIERMIHKWRSAVTLAATAASEAQGPGDSEGFAGSRLRRLSATLSCALLREAVEARMTRMIIVPDADLGMLPFNALPENGCHSKVGEPLVVGHEITMAPSLSIFLSRRAPVETHQFKGELAIVADPVFDPGDSRAARLKRSGPGNTSPTTPSKKTDAILPRLLNSSYEARTIQYEVEKALGPGQVFVAVGLNASLQTVLSPTMRDYRIWHLATHGVYDESAPQFSGLVFSLVGTDGGPTLGFLKAHDIASLDLHAELVVLNACDYAGGENLSGEGVMGLSYAFLRAGARQVISTIWRVDDTVSKELMAVFYQKMTTNGNNAADALRQSQLAIMHRHQSSDAYYWAGFELTSAGN
jgi:CHAT domain-containing protein